MIIQKGISSIHPSDRTHCLENSVSCNANESAGCPQGVTAGLASLRAGGVEPRCLILDDGWQMTENDDDYSRAETKTEQWPLKLPGNLQGLLDRPWLKRYRLGGGQARKTVEGTELSERSKTAPSTSNGAVPGSMRKSGAAPSNGTAPADAGSQDDAAVARAAAQAAAMGDDARRVGSPLAIDDQADFAASQQSALASFADDLAGGSELMTTMPALADSGLSHSLVSLAAF